MIGFRFFLRLAFLILGSLLAGALFQQMHPAGILHRTSKIPRLQAATISATPQTHELLSAVWIENSSLPAAQPQTAIATLGSPDVPEVTWSQALEWVAKKQASLIDVRTKSSYDTGHVPNAVSFPIENFVKNTAPLLSLHPDPETKLIFYCSNIRCPQAMEAGRLMRTRHQRKEVYFIPGGYFQWRAENNGPDAP